MKVIQWDGQRITAPGLYANVPLDDYHRGDICDGPSISSTGLRTLWARSPAHYWDSSPLNPARREDTDNPDFVLGRAVHHLICRQPGFAKYFVTRPEKAPDGKAWHGNNKSCKDWLAQQKAAGRAVLTEEDIADIRGMAVSVGNTTLVRKGILDGLREHSMFWKDRETGVWLKARPDIIPMSSGDYADLKTTQSVMHLDVQRSLGKFGYHQQGALVLEGAKALDMEVNSFSLVWVEKARPYCTRVSTLIDEDLARGGRQNRAALRTFKVCLVNRSWPGPGDAEEAEYLGLPDSMRIWIDERLKLGLKEAA